MMRKKFNLFIVLFAFSLAGFAQVGGTVLDGDGLPLPGVNVIPAGNLESTITDFDGNFTLANTAVGTQVTFSMVGYSSVTVAASASMSVTLQEEASQLEEIVVIGYGTKKLGSITGSVAQVKAADIVKTPSQSPIQAIQGRAAGVNITATDDPGSKPTVMIRGLSTIMSDRNPLYIIDGVESFDDLGISPNDIATIDILKDASSLAIYGQKGSNGVIIITTKKGRSGDIKVNYDTYYGIKQVQNKVKMADGFRYTYYNNSALGNPNYFASTQPYETDWFDEITRTGEVRQHNVSLSGGSNHANYHFGAANYQEKGILNGTEYMRTNISSRTEFRFLDNKVKISPNVNLAISDNIDKPNSAFTTAYKQAPIVPVRFENGRWGVPLRNSANGMVDINGDDKFNNVGNPVADIFYTNAKNKEVLVYGSIAAEAQLLKQIKYTSSFGATYKMLKWFSFTPNSDLWLAQNPTSDLTDYENSFGNNPVIYNTLTQGRRTEYLWNWDNFVTYDDTFGKHHITVTAGMSRTTRNEAESIQGTRNNVPEQSNYWSLDMSSFNTEIAPGAVVQHNTSTPIVSIAYFGRAEYDYDGKYLFSASVRREGTSVFQTGKKWGIFPSVSAGWVVSAEDFMKDSKALDYLKIRGGYGELGNARVNSSVNQIVFGPNYNYSFGGSPTIQPGSSIPNAVDPNLTWETVKEIDFGLDLRTLDNRLSATFDIYQRKSEDLLVPISPAPVISPGRVTINAGSIENKGFESALRWDDKIGDKVTYFVGGNFSFNQNKLTEVNSDLFSDYTGGDLGNGNYTKKVIVGEALGTFFVYEVTGFGPSGAFTYSAERVAKGSYIPKYTYGISLGATYAGFDLSVDAYGVGGNKLFNGKKAQRFGGENIEYDYLDSFWTPSTPNAQNPYPYLDIPVPSDYFIEDGSYLRINNITLGYTFPKIIEQVDKVRLYFTAINPFIFTKFTGYSPELAGNGDPLERAGIELDAYPTNRTFMFGLNVSL